MCFKHETAGVTPLGDRVGRVGWGGVELVSVHSSGGEGQASVSDCLYHLARSLAADVTLDRQKRSG